jgi:UrcA family protein
MIAVTKIASAALALAVLAPLPAMAETKSIRISYSDLNLASASGKARLDRRIAFATRQICGVTDGDRSLPAERAARACAAGVKRNVEAARFAAISRRTPANS